MSNEQKLSDIYKDRQEQTQTGRKKKRIIVVASVILLIVVGIVIWLSLPKDQNDKGAIVITEDTRGGTGDMESRVAAGMIAVKMTGVWTFEDGNSAGDGYVANSLHNDAPLRILVQLSDTGETVLEVDSIPVGSCVENFKLSQDLAPGTYPAIVTHSTLDEAGNITNSVKTEIQIVVEK